ncbi:MAG TPA: FABP family protein [Acidimicrobiales bacterium]|nr:FABP family protein [Acidimicrobiales bacterium]
MSVDLAPECERFSGLIGRWSGRGSGDFPTIEPFEYLEEVTFSHMGRPFVVYAQKTRRAGTGEPLHTEVGYLRPVGEHGVEMLITQPTGISEIHTGTIGDGVMDLRSVGVCATPTAKQVDEVTRRFVLEGDSLGYEMHMAAVGQPLQFHLRAQLKRMD